MSASTTDPTVLLVDDDPATVELYAVALSHAGYRMRTVTSSTDALPQAASPEISMVVLDLSRSEMERWDVCVRLARDSSTSHLPVIVLSGLGRAERRRAASVDWASPTGEPARAERADVNETF
jgi:CheY-like chemotaxis protein